jgi:hypothetical protein
MKATAEERAAWDQYAAALRGASSAAVVANYADLLLEERRKRFPQEPKPEPKPPVAVPPPREC